MGKGEAHLLIANRELAGRHLVVLGKCLEINDGVILQHRYSKLDVRLGVLVTGL